MASYAFPISAPTEFTNTTAGDSLTFQARDGLSENKIQRFVTTTAGDLLTNLGTSGNFLQRLAIGSAGQVLTASGADAARAITVNFNALTGSDMGGKYFLINSPTQGYYVWFDVNAASTDPASLSPVPSDLRIGNVPRSGLEVNLTGTDTAAIIAAAAQVVIDGDAAFVATVDTTIVSITNAVAGLADAPADGASPNATTVTLTTSDAGSSILPAWSTPIGSVSETFMASVSATTSDVGAGSWTTLSSSYVTWNDSSAPNHDGGSIFTASSGVFAVPTTGIWELSAGVQFEADNTGINNTINGRRAIRQVRIHNVTTSDTLAFSERQAEASGTNPTFVGIPSTRCSVTAADSIVVQVRHDANSPLGVTFAEDGAVSGRPSFFSSIRVAKAS